MPATSRSKYRRKLKQCDTQFVKAMEYLAEIGEAYQEAKPSISEACAVGFRFLHQLRMHVERITENL